MRVRGAWACSTGFRSVVTVMASGSFQRGGGRGTTGFRPLTAEFGFAVVVLRLVSRPFEPRIHVPWLPFGLPSYAGHKPQTFVPQPSRAPPRARPGGSNP